MPKMRTWLAVTAWVVSLVGCDACPQPPLVAVTVAVTDDAGDPIDDVEVECAFEDEPFERGDCIGRPGHYTVRVTRGDQVVEREVDVEVDGRPQCNLPDTQRVTIVLPDPSAV